MLFTPCHRSLWLACISSSSVPHEVNFAHPHPDPQGERLRDALLAQAPGDEAVPEARQAPRTRVSELERAGFLLAGFLLAT
jgi:hypothetical protein